MFSNISQNSQENTFVRASFLIKLQTGLMPATLLKRRLRQPVFSCEFCEDYKNTFFIKLLWLLLLSSITQPGRSYLNGTKSKQEKYTQLQKYKIKEPARNQQHFFHIESSQLISMPNQLTAGSCYVSGIGVFIYLKLKQNKVLKRGENWQVVVSLH